MTTPIVSSDLRRPAIPLMVISVLAVLVAILAAIGWARAFTAAQPREQPLLITACAPDDFAADGFCDGDPPVDPGVLVLSPDLHIAVAGRTILTSDNDVAYSVRVSWVSVDSGAEIPVVGPVPVTYEAGRNEPYGLVSPFVWAVPPQLVALVDGVPSGESLGAWRIVGFADPVDRDRFAPYQWDSVKTFELVAP